MSVLYFTSSHCAPCKILLPKLQRECLGRNIDLRLVSLESTDPEDENLFHAHQVMSFPTILVGAQRINPNRANLQNIREALDGLVSSRG